MSRHRHVRDHDRHAVAADAALLDRLAAGSDGPDEASRLLAALRDEARAGDPGAVSVSPPAAPEEAAPPAALHVRRRTVAAAVVVGTLLSAGGTAAALTGDPVAPLRTVIELVRDEQPERPAPRPADDDVSRSTPAHHGGDRGTLLAEATEPLRLLHEQHRTALQRELSELRGQRPAVQDGGAGQDQSAIPAKSSSSGAPEAADPEEEPATGDTGHRGADTHGRSTAEDDTGGSQPAESDGVAGPKAIPRPDKAVPPVEKSVKQKSVKQESVQQESVQQESVKHGVEEPAQRPVEQPSEPSVAEPTKQPAERPGAKPAERPGAQPEAQPLRHAAPAATAARTRGPGAAATYH